MRPSPSHRPRPAGGAEPDPPPASGGGAAEPVEAPAPVEAAAPPIETPAAPEMAQTTPRPDSSSPAVASASPSPDAEVTGPDITIDTPTDGAGVPSHLVVRGRRAAEASPGQVLWLIVRAQVDGSRWYALGRSLDVRPDGSWEATIELGGAAGIRH